MGDGFLRVLDKKLLLVEVDVKLIDQDQPSPLRCDSSMFCVIAVFYRVKPIRPWRCQGVCVGVGFQRQGGESGRRTRDSTRAKEYANLLRPCG